jgi:hypothetical protein
MQLGGPITARNRSITMEIMTAKGVSFQCFGAEEEDQWVV